MKGTLVVAIFLSLCGGLIGADWNGGYGHDNSYGGHYDPGFYVRPGSVAAVYNNAVRQLGVNDIARYVGSGTGTAYYWGVPGTGNYFNHKAGYDRKDHY